MGVRGGWRLVAEDVDGLCRGGRPSQMIIYSMAVLFLCSAWDPRNNARKEVLLSPIP